MKTKSSRRWEGINRITRKLLLPLFVVVCLVADTNTRAITAKTTSATTTSQLGNISTRGLVQTGAGVMIGGFIIEGTEPKTVIVRAIGPELIPPPYNIPNALADPNLQLFDGTGTLIAQNDNWQTTEIFGIITGSQVSAIQNSGHAPSLASESAIIATLQPGAYTAIVSGANNTTGIALVEVYDLSPDTTSIPGNISTRGLVQTGANILDGGFIVQGTQPKTVIVRAIGPELIPPPYNIPNALANPNLQLFDSTGTLIAQNDNWQTTEIFGIITSSQVSVIQNSGHAPSLASESAIIATLQPGAYTAIVSGANNTTGVALVEVYDIDLRVFSVSNSSPVPFELIHLDGAGFNPSATMSVHFFNDSGFSVEMPVADATATSVDVLVPPYMEPATQTFSAGTVSFEVLQTTGIGTSTSNTTTGLSVADMPTPTMPPGTVTANWAGFLELHLNDVEADLAAAAASSGGQVNTADLTASLEASRLQFGSLKTLIRASIADPSQTPAIGLLNGIPITLNQAMLRQSDQLVLAMFQQLSASLGAQFDQVWASLSGHIQGTEIGLSTTTGCNLQFITVFNTLVGQPNSESLTNANFKVALQQCADYYRDVVAPALNKYGTAFTVMSLIPLNPGAPVSAVFAATLPWLSVGAQGLAARLDSAAAAANARDPVAFLRSQSAWEGTFDGFRCGVFSKLLGPITGSSIIGEWGTLLVDQAMDWSGICDTKVPSLDAQICTLVHCTFPAFTLSIATNGTGSGIVIPYPIGPTYSPGEIATLTAVPDSGSIFALWSGAAIGTGQALVLMNVDKSVTATFTLSHIPTPTPTPTATPTPPPSPTPSGTYYCINEWHWIYPPGNWNTDLWYGSDMPGQYPNGSPECNVYPYTGCITTFTYDCGSCNPCPNPCGPICPH